MTELLNVSPLSLMELWAELIECYHGVNKYAGNTAEIYAYRFQMYSPAIHSFPQRSGLVEKSIQSNHALIELCSLFAERYDCNVLINDRYISDWQYDYEFNHRVHITVERQS